MEWAEIVRELPIAAGLAGIGGYFIRTMRALIADNATEREAREKAHRAERENSETAHREQMERHFDRFVEKLGDIGAECHAVQRESIEAIGELRVEAAELRKTNERMSVVVASLERR